MTISQTNPARIHPFPDDGRVVHADESLREAGAARLVARGRDPDPAGGERFLRYARKQAIPLGGLWVWLSDGGAVQAASLVVPNPGKTAMIFASRAMDDTCRRKVIAAVERACAAMADDGIFLVQSLLEPRERAERRLFEAAGFEFLATLAYLQRSSTGRRAIPPASWPPGSSLESFSEANEVDFIRALGESYEETLDCPGLSGLRRTEDILAGHKATGQFDPGLWTLVRLNGRSVAILLLNRSAQQNTIELVYLGLLRSARGRGIGRSLLHHGLAQCADAGASAVTLAVDEKNTPAMRLYARAGFRRILRRVAVIRSLRTDMEH